MWQWWEVVWMLVLGVCGMGAALYYNHQKILYTVVYVPMFVLSAAKTVILLLITLPLTIATLKRTNAKK